MYGKYEVNDTEIDSDTFNNQLGSGKGANNDICILWWLCREFRRVL